MHFPSSKRWLLPSFCFGSVFRSSCSLYFSQGLSLLSMGRLGSRSYPTIAGSATSQIYLSKQIFSGERMLNFRSLELRVLPLWHCEVSSSSCSEKVAPLFCVTFCGAPSLGAGRYLGLQFQSLRPAVPVCNATHTGGRLSLSGVTVVHEGVG